MKLPLRPITIVVTIVLLVSTVAMSMTAGAVRDDLEDKLLEERSKEIALVLGQIGGQIQTLLSSLTTVVRATGADADAFVVAAAPFVESGFGEILVAVPDGDGIVVANTTGGTTVGDRVDDDAAAVMARAADPTAFTSAVFERDSGRVLALALLVGSPDGAVLYTEASLEATAEGAADSDEQAFAEVKLAMYLDPSLSDDAFIFSTDDERVFDDQVVEPITFGDGEWAVAVAARGNLAGDLTAALPLILFVAGLLLTVAGAVVIESTQRRREYAERLVRAREAELEVAHRKLVEAERAAAVGEMAATMAHELRNPLGVLTNVHYLLRARAGGDDEPFARQLDRADREVGAATSIVSDILAFTKPRDLITGPAPLGEIVREAIEATPPNAGVDVVVDGIPTDLVVDVDRDLARQAIAALLANAEDAIADRGDGGRISVSVDDAGALVIADDGVGMDPQVLAQAFEPFFSTRINGVGLGLTVAGQIAAAHGGSLDVTSERETGTTAVLRLPQTAPVESAAGAQEAES